MVTSLQAFRLKFCMPFSFLHVLHVLPISLLDLIILITFRHKFQSSLCNCLLPPVASSPSGPNILLSNLSQICSLYVVPVRCETKFHIHMRKQINLYKQKFDLQMFKQEMGLQKILDWEQAFPEFNLLLTSSLM
jgi:hypothetical protein